MTKTTLTLRPLIVLAAAAAVACGSNGGDPKPVTSQRFEPARTWHLKTLNGENSCAALQSELRSLLDRRMTEALSWYFLVADHNVTAGPVANASPAPASATTAPGGAAQSNADSGSTQWSGTNNQVAGVDEMDVVKNAGRAVFRVRADAREFVLHRVSLLPADQMQVGGRLGWEGIASTATPAGSTKTSPAATAPVSDSPVRQNSAPFGLLRPDEGTVVAITPYLDGAAMGPQDLAWPVWTGVNGWGTGTAVGTGFRQHTELRVFDASTDLSRPMSLRKLVQLDGQLVDARQFGTRIVVLTRAAVNGPAEVSLWPGSSWNIPRAEFIAGLEKLIAKNREIIGRAPLESMLADARRLDAGPMSAAECGSYMVQPSGQTAVVQQIHVIDLASDKVETRRLVAAGETMHLSPKALVLAGNHYASSGTIDQRSAYQLRTAIHRFPVDTRGGLGDSMSASVEGRTSGQYTIEQRADDSIRLALQTDSGSRITALGIQGADLAELGRTETVAAGESMRAARFIGDRAYLVTFRNTDPFFVFDVADGSAMKKLGELKIPGFSTYLHPVDATHILGLGVGPASGPTSGTQGVNLWGGKLSLFDVSDPMNPREESTMAIGDQSEHSEGLYNPRALSFYPDQRSGTGPLNGVYAGPGTLAIPFSAPNWSTGSLSQAVHLVHVQPGLGAASLSLSGKMNLSDIGTTATQPNKWRADLRGIFVDDLLFGINERGIRSAKIATPGQAIQTIETP